MNPIDPLFGRLRQQRRPAFIPFLTAGDPNLDFTVQALWRLAAAGADLIEVGFPFSDPIADGPVIQESYTRALRQGLTQAAIFGMLRRLTSTPGWRTPLVGMVSYSLIFRKDPAQFVSQAAAAGLSGIVVPDLPAEEAQELAPLCRQQDFKLILLVTPTTSSRRTEQIVNTCTGFIYVVSVVGITGAREELPAGLTDLLGRLRQLTDLPLCVGFGISKPAHVEQLRPWVDGVIVGSALVRRLADAANDPAGTLHRLEQAVRELRQPLDTPPSDR